ncbi:MAG: hypothetical protein E7K68_03475, partial [Corynebacterium kroppenstedtii]|nr:hypothetical protein [Corynebacterium kroppenstedtii]
MFHVKHSELPPHGGDVRDASTSSAHRRDSTVCHHASTPPVRDEPSGDPINQRDVGQIDQHENSREDRRRQSWAEKAILFYQYGI